VLGLRRVGLEQSMSEYRTVALGFFGVVIFFFHCSFFYVWCYQDYNELKPLLLGLYVTY